MDAYVFRPCIVAGHDALLLIEDIVRQFQLGGRSAPFRALAARVPGLKPVLPDNGVPFQLVHHDDVATALRAAVVGEGTPGIYNLAADDLVTMRDVAADLGWRRIAVPNAAVTVAAELVARVPQVPTGWAWVNALRVPSVMDTTRARRELGWRPRHDARETLRQTVRCAREHGLV